MGGSASIPAIANINTTGEIQNTEATASNVSLTYDPLWANALAFLDYLEQKSLLSRDIATARIGQFVLTSGELHVSSTALSQKIYQHDAARERELYG